MTDRDDQVGAIECVEMKFMHAVRMQSPALLSRERGRDEAARIRVIVKALEMRPHPGRDRGSASRGHAPELREIRNRQNSRHDRHVDAGSAGAVAETQEYIDIEKELRDRAAGAGVE